MDERPWEIWSSRVRAENGATYFIDVKEGNEGRRVVVTQSYPSGVRHRITLAPTDVGPVVGELLKAVSALVGTESTPAQHPPATLAAIRQRYPNAYQPWTPEDDACLLAERAKGHGIAHLGRLFGRPPGAIQSRLGRLGDPARSQPSAVRTREDPVRRQADS